MTQYRAELANNLLLFFVSIAFAGVLIAIFNEPFETIESVAADVGETEHAADGLAYIVQFWEFLPIVVVFLGLIQLVAAATVEAQTP